MRRKVLRSCILSVTVNLFTAGILSAQVSTDVTKPAYLGFEQFSTVAIADRLGFLDKVIWAGMNFVYAPAAKRIVPLYEYNSEDIAKADCSADKHRTQRALLATWLVPKKAVPGKLLSKPSVELGRGFEGQDKWLTLAELKELLPKAHNLEGYRGMSVPVWHELSVSNSCDLKRAVADLDYKALAWHPIDNPKLLSTIRSKDDSVGLMAAFKAHVIVTEPFFSKKIRQKKYFAECIPLKKRERTYASICNTVLKQK